MEDAIRIFREATKYQDNLEECYKAGYDAAVSGPNTDNCHFGYFATYEMKNEWERGNRDGKKSKEPPQ